jgi:hypothetical protein
MGEGSRGDEEAGIALVQQARIGAKWIACDCLGPDTRPPVLTPAFLSEAETYYLRRLTGADRLSIVPNVPSFASRRPIAFRRSARPILRPIPRKAISKCCGQP